MAAAQNEQIKSLARACEFCRTRKIRCDIQKPSCGSCASQRRECVYKTHVPKERPTTAVLTALRAEKRELAGILQRLKDSTPEEAIKILQAISIHDETQEIQVPLPTFSPVTPSSSDPHSSMAVQNRDESNEASSDGDLDVSPFLSVDDYGNLDSFGPSSALQSSTIRPLSVDSLGIDHIRNGLIAKAVLARQREYELHSLPELDGVPMELAMHLLELHWNRQHHTFLLTYRPAIMRDLLHGGPYSSKFLLNAIFACASKFSQRAEVLDIPGDLTSAGSRFFRRCDDLLLTDSLLMTPNIATIVGLLLLGSTFNARGNTSKGWLYTGYALRMVYDLGLHLDRKVTHENAEDVEIRRRVFWGAFICDKLQSLYLGRPMAIQLRDAHVSHQLMDSMEERELWTPYTDPTLPDSISVTYAPKPTPIHSVSCFQQLCRLSKIMTKIINKFYVIGATAAGAKASLQALDDSLVKWNTEVPKELCYNSLAETGPASTYPAPNVMILHGVYHSLIILLHRPLIAEGHLRSENGPASSWQRCTAAARNISYIVSAYRSAYTLRGAPYLLSYALYVACTIQVRNAAALEENHRREHSSLLASSLKCLDELTVPNSGVSRSAGIIRKLMVAKGINLSSDTDEPVRSVQETRGKEQDFVDHDMNAYMRMTSSSSTDSQQGPEAPQFGLAGWLGHGNEHPFQADLLYGFMDEYPPMDFAFPPET